MEGEWNRRGGVEENSVIGKGNRIGQGGVFEKGRMDLYERKIVAQGLKINWEKWQTEGKLSYREE